MLKPDSLRDWLRRAVPWIAEEPERLQIFVAAGNMESTLGSPSVVLRYTLQITLVGYPGQAAEVLLPLGTWLQRNAPDLVGAPDKAGEQLRFETDRISDTETDIRISLPLREFCQVRPGAGGALEYRFVPEPEPESLDGITHWSLWLRDRKLAEWTV